MFQGRGFPTVDSSDAVGVKYRQAIEAEFASMGEVWREHEEHFWI
jgi:hypothetical protein